MIQRLIPYAMAALAAFAPLAAAAQTADDTMVVTYVIRADSVVHADTVRFAPGRPATDTLDEARTALAETAEKTGRQPAAPRHFLPTARRIDREINRNKFVYKGETLLGLTASYGTLSSEDADMFPIFEGISLSGSVASVNPFVGYFYRDNNCIGLRLGYSRIAGTLDSFGVNLGELNDLELDIPWIDVASNRYSAGLFHRSYVALDDRGRFGLFGEFELSYAGGRNTFAYRSGEQLRHTESNTSTVRMLFSPGVAVYAFPNVCMTLSFGLGGFKYTAIRQYDQTGAQTGSRDYSNLNFRLNLADIRIGMTIHLWNKKKDRLTERP